jgi:hypothetical protein
VASIIVETVIDPEVRFKIAGTALTGPRAILLGGESCAKSCGKASVIHGWDSADGIMAPPDVPCRIEVVNDVLHMFKSLLVWLRMGAIARVAKVEASAESSPRKFLPSPRGICVRAYSVLTTGGVSALRVKYGTLRISAMNVLYL